MSLSDIPNFVSRWLQLPAHADSAIMDDILEPSLQAEAELRRAYASNRQDPRLLDKFVGMMDIFKLPASMRTTRSRQGHNARPEDSSWSDNYIFPLQRDICQPNGSPSTVHSFSLFLRNFDIFSSGILNDLDWSNVVVAGGAILACLSPPPEYILNNDLLGQYYHQIKYRSSDIDLFLYGLSEDEARLKMMHIFANVRRRISFGTTCVRKKHTITIVSQYPYRHLQVVLRLYASPAEILAGFDVDSSCFLFDGEAVYTNPRGITALSRQCNMVDISRRSPSYEHRLYKYSKRGFEVRLPTLQRQVIRTSIYDAELPSPMPKGLARLLILEHISKGGAYDNFHPPAVRKLEGNARSAPRQTLELSLDSAGAHSWYDSGLLRIPYGGRWDAAKIGKLLDNMQARLNWLSTFDKRGDAFPVPEYLVGHYHGVFHGTMAECLGEICPGCPSTFHPQHDYGLGDNIQGPLRFITDNPGQQLMTGSFNPLDAATWEEDAYIPDDAPLPFMNPWAVEM